MGVVEDPDALQEAATMERECYTSIKNSFQEMQKVVEARSSSERSIVNEKTVFEIAYDKVRHSFFTVDTLCRSMLLYTRPTHPILIIHQYTIHTCPTILSIQRLMFPTLTFILTLPSRRTKWLLVRMVVWMGTRTRTPRA